jgi:predicted nuclease of predicted toxin-antitoxin system
MRLLANENFPLDAVEALREDGHDVGWIREDSHGASDEKVLQRAQEENRIVITFDKDFGELAFRSKLPAQSGVILFRITPKSSQYIAQAAVQALASRDNWAGHFSVVEDNRIRMTSLSQE